MRFIFQNHLEIEANDNFQVPTEMEVDHNQQNCGNPNEIRPPEKIEIKKANQVSIFKTYRQSSFNTVFWAREKPC